MCAQRGGRVWRLRPPDHPRSPDVFLPQLDQPGDPKAAIAAGLEGSWLNGGCSVWVYLVEEWKCMKESAEKKRGWMGQT